MVQRECRPNRHGTDDQRRPAQAADEMAGADQLTRDRGGHGSCSSPNTTVTATATADRPTAASIGQWARSR